MIVGVKKKVEHYDKGPQQVETYHINVKPIGTPSKHVFSGVK